MLSGPASPAARCAACALLAATAVAAAAPGVHGQVDTLPRKVERTNLGQRIGRQVRRQVNVSVDAGAAAVTYDDFLNSNVASVTPTVRVESARTLLIARSSFSQFESGNRSVQASLAGSVVSPELFNLRGELFGATSLTRFARELAATNLYGAGRLHLASLTAGAWAGAGLGLVSQRTRLPDDVGQLDVGLWAREGPLTYTFTLLPTRVASRRYADVTASARWQGTLGELTVSSGYRARASREIPGVRAWAEGWATVWLGTRVAAVGGVGLFPFEPVQGLPGGRYLSAALRVATRRPVVNDPALRAELMLPYEVRRLRDARAEQFVVEENGDGARVLHLRVPGAHRVELMADFTDWMPVPLVRLDHKASGKKGGRKRNGPQHDDVWSVALVIAPGVHRVNVRVDGGPWRPPPGLSVARDEFGGEVGLLVVQ